MSRPVYEPSLTRQDAAQAWASRQLFRRPAPVSGAPIEIFRAVRWATALAVGSGGSQITVNFEEWNYCDSTVFCPLDTGLNINPVPGVDLVQRVRLSDCGTGYLSTVPGKYDIYFSALANSFDGDIELALHDGDDTTGTAEVYRHSNRAGFGGAFVSAMWTHIYPIWDFQGAEASVAELSFTIAQINAAGLSKDFVCWMEIHFNPNVNVCGTASS